MEMLTRAAPQAFWAARTSSSVIVERGLSFKKVKVQVL
eukprot:CAMPEP_0168404708 /NCGR_PEP_ID=MMETSP0228-20121227/24775_1 /TAXON_ID=133427 /ORGANISM="Protoceratium reticulatum, Strain CCCM 535 (=CCMP 1889)" /LENGTH=37 /DNA_ID= /DNA_START= /DNA_END= /DNA_ORIENTATION=